MVRRRIKARVRHGVLEPSEPLGLEEGVEVELEVTVDEHEHGTEEAEDAGLARAIQEGLTTERVPEDVIMAILRDRDGD
ncbi:MAG: hypothetical protein F4Y98_10015 [Chloroflexi bacterium]|nr:hypothetical protein [Chloroflexota bacterium]